VANFRSSGFGLDRSGICSGAAPTGGFRPSGIFYKVLLTGMLATVKVRGSFVGGFYCEIGPEGKPVEDPGLGQSGTSFTAMVEAEYARCVDVRGFDRVSSEDVFWNPCVCADNRR